MSASFPHKQSILDHLLNSAYLLGKYIVLLLQFRYLCDSLLLLLDACLFLAIMFVELVQFLTEGLYFLMIFIELLQGLTPSL